MPNPGFSNLEASRNVCLAILASGQNPDGSAFSPNLTGTWGYLAGTSGTVNVGAGARVVGIAAHATSAGSMTVNAGPSIPIPANTMVALSPMAQLVAPTVVFTGTDSYVIETLS